MKKTSLMIGWLFFILSIPVLSANNVSQIEIEGVLFSNGSAHITQEWQGTFSEGTENYIVIENLDGITLSDFEVWDETGPYTFLPHWDVKASFEEKAGKYGIVETKDGYELCFGITQYGERNYRFSYRLNGLAASYSDYDGFYLCLSIRK